MLRFVRINTQEDLDKLNQFAQSFGHDASRPLGPMFALARDEKIFGYFNVMNRPVVFPAFHPEIASPRDVYESLQQVRAWQLLSSADQGVPSGTFFCGLPTGVDEKFPTKIGLVNLKTELWQC
jgi:hypothetical protein